jgi:hypothetical protein
VLGLGLGLGKGEEEKKRRRRRGTGNQRSLIFAEQKQNLCLKTFKSGLSCYGTFTTFVFVRFVFVTKNNRKIFVFAQ